MGNSCGYIEEMAVVGGTEKHHPRKSTEPVTAATVGVVAQRRYCILPIGHGAAHSFRTQ